MGRAGGSADGRRPARGAALLAAVVVLAALAGGCGLLGGGPSPEDAAAAFLAAWAAGPLDPALLVDETETAAAQAQMRSAVEGMGTTPTLRVLEVVRDVERDDLATARVGVSWRLPDGTWDYTTRLALTRGEEAWLADWSSTALHPQLEPGWGLRRRAVVPERASVLAGDGSRLFTDQPIVDVGVQPGRVEDLDAVLGVLDTTLGIEPEALRERVEASRDDQFVDVITLRRPDYDALRDVLRPVPGLVFREDERQLTSSTAFGRALLGTVGPPTAELLEEVEADVGPGFGAGDDVGRSGLQRAFQAQLAGTPGWAVDVVDGDGEAVATPYETAPTPGEALRTTLDPAVQAAADAAVAGHPATIVALRASTGEVLAVAHGPDGGTANTAFTGEYPPGSTYKIVSTAALLASGVAPDASVSCPETATVHGRTFRNSEGRAYGTVSLRTAFAQSCNTTYAEQVDATDDAAMAEAAEAFGIGGDWDPGVAAFPGSAPEPVDDVERVAAMIGQGRVLASPLGMAAVAAAVADGTWRPPVLLPDHADPGSGPRPLDPAVAATLADYTRAVVTEGTGSALADVPGGRRGASGPPLESGEVRAKTGTAEYGTEDPPRTHAWAVGSRDDLAFAVFVADGAAGGSVAAPLAADFLRAVDAGGTGAG